MYDFTYTALPVRVVFGPGKAATLDGELDRLGIRRALLLTTPGRRTEAEAVAAHAKARIAAVFDGARMHVPVETVAQALKAAGDCEADGTVAVGGGSTVGLGKAIALESGLPQVAVPTTYAGSEMTPIWGKTEGGVKTTGRDPAVLPKTVIYDPELSIGLPPNAARPSGMNAIAHCVEALYAPDRNPVVDLIAEEGIRAIATGLPRIAEASEDNDPRAECLYGAWLAGLALGSTSMGLHHKLCHVLGGTFDLPHAELHTAILPHAAAYNRSAAPRAMGRIARALGSEDAPRALYELAKRIGAPTALEDIGMPKDGIDKAAAQAASTSYANPATVTEDGVRALLRTAYAGAAPD